MKEEHSKQFVIIDLTGSNPQDIVSHYVEQYFVPFIPSEITLEELQYDNTAECKYIIQLKKPAKTYTRILRSHGIYLKTLGELRLAIRKLVGQVWYYDYWYETSPELNQWIIDYLFELDNLVKQYCHAHRSRIIHEYKIHISRPAASKKRRRKLPTEGEDYSHQIVDWDTIDLTIKGNNNEPND